MRGNFQTAMSVAPVLAAGAILACLSSGETTRVAHAADPAAAAAQDPAPQGVPVEPDMHEFMEYVFQPSYRRLKPAMAAASTESTDWNTIKSEALLLAEGGNLLLLRPSDENVDDWKAHSVAVRKEGGELYAAARKKDLPTVKENYQQLIKACNACHQQFAHGEYQLKP